MSDYSTIETPNFELGNFQNIVDSLKTKIIYDVNTLQDSKQATLTSSTDLCIKNLTTNELIQNFQQINDESGTFYTLDNSNGSVFYLTNSPNGNFTVQINNIANDVSKTSIITLIYKANYIPSTILIYSGNGTSQIIISSSTPLWTNRSTPSITSADIVIVRFSFFKMFSSNYCCADLTYY
jgi:hypothetical protein